MKNKIILIANLFLVTTLNAQTIPYLVTSFGGTGYVTDNFSQSNDLLYSTPTSKCIKLDNNNKLIVGGNVNSVRKQDVFICRYNSNGTLDNTFDFDGRKIIKDVKDSVDVFKNLFIDSQNNIYIVYSNLVEYYTNFSYEDDFGNYSDIMKTFKVTKILNDGSIDASYGKNGTFSMYLGNLSPYRRISGLCFHYQTVSMDSESNIYFSIPQYKTDTNSHIVKINRLGNIDIVKSILIKSQPLLQIANNELFVSNSNWDFVNLEKYNLNLEKINTFVGTSLKTPISYNYAFSHNMIVSSETKSIYLDVYKDIYKFDISGNLSTIFGVNGVKKLLDEEITNYTPKILNVSKNGNLFITVVNRFRSSLIFKLNSSGFLDESFNGDGAFPIPTHLYTGSTDYPSTSSVISNDGVQYVVVPKLGIAAVKIENVTTIGINPTSISSFTNSPLLSYSIYPNPSTGTFTIESALPIKEQIVVFNVFGVAVQTISSKGENTVKVSGLTTGMYLVQIGGFKQKVMVE